VSLFGLQVLQWVRTNLLLALTIGGVLVGVIVGFLGRLVRLSDESVMLVSFPGEILMRLLKMFILPLIISSLVSGDLCAINLPLDEECRLLGCYGVWLL
jgi:L-cystine uptake protein TcyP (sodium:dicarboxylate symporter family)